MLRFVYIEARDVSVPADGGVIVSFAAVILTAENEDSAYEQGPALLAAQLQQMLGDDATFTHASGQLLNDFVVTLLD